MRDEGRVRVCGLRVRRAGDAEEVLPADVVVDCFGARSKAPDWLRAEDLYVIADSIDPKTNTVYVKVLVKPLVNLIWVAGFVFVLGSLVSIVFQMAGGLRAAMGYCGCASIEEMREKAEFVEITSAGIRESHVHDVQITKEAPNYRAD